jgi:hypothetical protein
MLKPSAFVMLLCLLGSHSFCQPYQPFIVEGAHWTVTDSRCDGCNFGLNYPQGIFTLWFKLQDDTLINNITYKKLWESLSGTIYITSNTPVPYCNEWAVEGYVREDTALRKVFIIGNLSGDCGMVSHVDTPFIDFSLGIGDTSRAHMTNPSAGLISGNICRDSAFLVDSVDSSGFQTWTRRTVHLIPASNINTKPYYIYEGIGPSYGLIGGPKGGNNTAYSSSLVSYCVGPDSLCGRGANCGNATGIAGNSFTPPVLVYPNPSTGAVFIEANEPLQQVEIFDMSGRRLMIQTPDKPGITIQAAQLPAGIYFCRMKLDNQITVQKIVIE